MKVPPNISRALRRACDCSVVLALAAHLPLAQSETDPLKSAACDQAMQRLESLRRGTAAAAQTEEARQQATQACLRGPGPAQLPPRSAQAPTAVPPVPAPPPAFSPPPASFALQPLPAPVERPSAVSHCDPGGCWDSDGRRLNRVGQDVIGPRAGVCMPMGAVL